MKKQSIVLLFTLLVSSFASAADLLPAKEMRITIKDPSTDYSQLSVEVKWHCSYTSGWVWRESKSCTPDRAVNSLTVTSDTNGIVRMPSLAKFSGARAGSSSNYEVSYYVNYQGTQIFSVHARGSKEIKTLAKEKLDIVVTKMDATDIYVNIDGSPVAGSPRSQLEGASIGMSINARSSRDLLDENLFSIFSGTYNAHYRNNQRDSDPKLRDFQKFSVPDLYVAYLAKDGLEANLYIVFYEQNAQHSFMQDMTHRLAVELTDSPDALRNLQTVELPPYQD